MRRRLPPELLPRWPGYRRCTSSRAEPALPTRLLRRAAGVSPLNRDGRLPCGAGARGVGLAARPERCVGVPYFIVTPTRPIEVPSSRWVSTSPAKRTTEMSRRHHLNYSMLKPCPVVRRRPPLRSCRVCRKGPQAGEFKGPLEVLYLPVLRNKFTNDEMMVRVRRVLWQAGAMSTGRRRCPGCCSPYWHTGRALPRAPPP